ncbi:MAG: aminotransferase class I/II-fold pyridoxal phosphate-dependent enzyme [Calditrichaceae bacterium]|nr:aminotransferase class I/II-fold pyridoxal phosphate-dependent enzyme [Calditrichia bacterium]NUQ42691.1 aminotransferase class I/II-fold pyridoxal phosphate-dependent enzyme [Calditrichaceae bacterium]
MSLEKLNRSLVQEVEALKAEGRAKAPERIIVGYLPPRNGRGPRYQLRGSNLEFLRMNSNSYLSLSNHPELIKAADEATHRFGVGPGAVRFIDGTFSYHAELEERIARFVNKPAAKIFNSAYTANLAVALTINNAGTYWIGDELNHNCIIRAMRISNVPRENRAIYKHNNMEELKNCLNNIPPGMERIVVIFDGIFSMRGDCAPLNEIVKLTEPLTERFKEGVITVVDDSHGIGAYGDSGRGTEEFTGAKADVLVGTFGKAFGVNGGFIAGSEELIEAVRQKADTYIYTNPLSVADCAAAIKAIEIAGGAEGRERLRHLKARTGQFRNGLAALGRESIPGPHPVVPLLVRDTARTRQLVQHLFQKGILVIGLTFPVVPRGDETIRFQINAAHTESDIDEVLEALSGFKA